VPHGNLVGIQVENLVLREPLLDLDGQQGFLELAAVGLFRGKEERPRQLLGDGGSALGAALAQEIAQEGPGDAGGVEAGMLVEAGILHGDDGVAKGFGDLVGSQGDAAFREE